MTAQINDMFRYRDCEYAVAGISEGTCSIHLFSVSSLSRRAPRVGTGIMRFHPAWKYERVVELIFADGILTQEFDRSEKMAELRQRFLELRAENQSDQMPTKADIAAFVERSFDRSYHM